MYPAAFLCPKCQDGCDVKTKRPPQNVRRKCEFILFFYAYYTANREEFQVLYLGASMGAKQYLIFGAGYDTFAYGQPYWADGLVIFEIDHPATARDKREPQRQPGERVKKQSYFDIEPLLSNCGFQIHEHLRPQEMTEQYFAAYNKANPTHLMSAFDHVNDCLGVRE